jgi:hypothetical protein
MASNLGLFTRMVGSRGTLVEGLAAYSAQTAVSVKQAKSQAVNNILSNCKDEFKGRWLNFYYRF